MMNQPLASAMRSAGNHRTMALEAGHQGTCDAEADESSRDCERGEAVGRCKERSPASRDGQEDGLDAARSEAVEPDAEGELDEAEGEEVGGRQKPEIPR
jgi:hypothetical protein